MEHVIEIVHLYKSYEMNGQKLPVLEDVNLHAEAGEFVSIIGPSGCGKSTLFRTIAGLESDYEGIVLVNGHEVRKQKPHISYMLQKDLLLPWRTVWRNIVLPLEIAGNLKNANNDYLKGMISEFGLSDFLNAYPDELSGGMRQRAALLRTWLMDGSIMLLDEPFGALDALTRNHMQDWLTEVWENHRKTVLFITHDIDEAIYMSDRIFVMSSSPGRLIESVTVSLERPRKREMLYTGTFLEYKKHLMSLLKVNPL